MKRFCGFLFFLIVVAAAYGQCKQDGFVKEYSEKSKKKPIAGVELLISNASPNVSGKNGDFHLQFLTLKPGDLIQVHDIYKAGYEIFNKEQLEVWRVSKNNEPFTIVLCKSSMFKALKDQYNAIAYKSYETQRMKELETLDKLLKNNQLKEEEYIKQKRSLCLYYDEKLSNLKTYIDHFARIDLQQVSRDERRIVNLVKTGYIQEAIDAYNALKLDEMIMKNYQEYQKADSAVSELSKISAKKKVYEENLLASLNNKYNLMMMQGQKEAIDSILIEYENLALKCPHSVRIIQSFVDFAYQEHDARLVAKWGRILLDLLPDNPILKQKYCYYVCNAELTLNNLDQSILYEKRAVEWMAKALKENPSSAATSFISSELHLLIRLILFENGLAKSLEKSNKINHLLDSLHKDNDNADMNYSYYINKHRLYKILVEIELRLQNIEKALEYQTLSSIYLDSLQTISSPDNEIKDLQVSTYNQMGYLYILTQDFDKAEYNLLKVHGIVGDLYNVDPYQYFSGILGNYTYLGMVYYYNGQLDKSLEIYKEAVDLTEELLITRPYPLFFTSYAELINNLGYLSFVTGDEEGAEKTFRRSIEKGKPFIQKNPFNHLSAVCTPQINLGTLLLKQNRIEEFAELQKEYWINLEKVVNWLGINYNTSYAIALDNKGYYELLQGNKENALTIWGEVNNLVPNYLEINPMSLLYKGFKEHGLLK